MLVIEKRLAPGPEFAERFPYSNGERNFFDKDCGRLDGQTAVGWHICSIDGRTQRTGWGRLNAGDFNDWSVIEDASAVAELDGFLAKAIEWEHRDQRALLIDTLPLFYARAQAIVGDSALYHATGSPLAYGHSLWGVQYQPLGLLVQIATSGKYAMACPRCGGRAALLNGGRGLSGGKGTLWCVDCRQTSSCEPPTYSYRHMIEEFPAPPRRATALLRLDEAADILLALERSA